MSAIDFRRQVIWLKPWLKAGLLLFSTGLMSAGLMMLSAPAAFAAPTGSIDFGVNGQAPGASEVGWPSGGGGSDAFHLHINYSLTPDGPTASIIEVTFPEIVSYENYGITGVTAQSCDPAANGSLVCRFQLASLTSTTTGDATVYARLNKPDAYRDGLPLPVSVRYLALDSSQQEIELDTDQRTPIYRGRANLRLYASSISASEWTVVPGTNDVGISWEYIFYANNDGYAFIDAGYEVNFDLPEDTYFLSYSSSNAPSHVDGNPIPGEATSIKVIGDQVLSRRYSHYYWVKVIRFCDKLPVDPGDDLLMMAQFSGAETRYDPHPTESAFLWEDVAQNTSRPPNLGAACGEGQGFSKTSTPKNKVGEGQSFTWAVTLTPPNAVFEVTNALVVDEIPAGLEFVDMTSYTGFTSYYCKLQGVSGNFDLAAFLGHSGSGDCQTTVPQDPTEVTHVAWYAPSWAASGAAPLNAQTFTFRTYVPIGAFQQDELITNVAHGEGTFKDGNNQDVHFTGDPSYEVMANIQAWPYNYIYRASPYINNNTEPLYMGQTRQFFVYAYSYNYHSNEGYARALNPTIEIDLPEELEFVSTDEISFVGPAFYNQSNCAWGESHPNYYTSNPSQTPLANNGTRLTYQVGNGTSPSFMGYNYNGMGISCSYGPLYIGFTVRLKPDSLVQDSTELVINTKITAENSSLSHSHSVPILVSRPGEMRVSVEPDCDADSRPSLLVSYSNSGGLDLSNVVVTVPIPKQSDGLGSQVDTEFYGIEGLPSGATVEYSINGGSSWTGTLPSPLSSITHIRVKEASFPVFSPTHSFKLVLSASGASTGNLIYGQASLDSTELSQIHATITNPVKFDVCPGVLSARAFYDWNQNQSFESNTDSPLFNWTIKVFADSAYSNLLYTWTTDINGYHQQNVDPGEYYMTLELPSTVTDGPHWTPQAPREYGPVSVLENIPGHQDMPLYCECTPEQIEALNPDECHEAVCDEFGACVLRGLDPMDPETPEMCLELCDESTTSCDAPYFYGVIQGPGGQLRSIKCQNNGGTVSCDNNNGELILGPPMCGH